jgi:Carboxypeptidase regulatory-like domain/Excalibur calcium-binding domain
MKQLSPARTRPAIRRIALAAAILAAVGAASYAGGAGADPAEVGSIAGTVSTAGDSSAVSAVEVDLYDGSGNPAGSTQPAADGSYSFDNLAPDGYTLHFAVTGAQASDYAAEWWNNQPLQADAIPVAVTAGQPTVLGDAHLDQVPLSSAPTIIGTAAVGQQLTSAVGQWRPTPDSFGYQWLADGVPISNATGADYLLTPAELGKQLTLAVTANRAGVEPITTSSEPTLAVVPGTFTVTPTPLITGTPVVGQTLLAVPGNWAPPSAVLHYLWYRNGIGRANTDKPTYLLTSADGSTRISVKVTATETGYLTTARPSAPTVAVLAPGAPRLTGVAEYGQLLQALPGSWLPTGFAFRYQWYVDLKPIPGAVASSYRPPLGTIGRSVWATVTGLKAGYAPVIRRTPSARIAPLSFVSVPTPRVLGTARVGSVLVASMPATSPASSIRFQWRLNGVTIPGAVSSGFRVRPTDVDRRFTVVITAIRAGYASVLRGSAYTAPAVGLAYPNCTALTSVYPHGVAKIGVRYDRVSGTNRALKGPPFFSTSLYNLNHAHNPDLDRDNDGIECER